MSVRIRRPAIIGAIAVLALGAGAIATFWERQEPVHEKPPTFDTYTLTRGDLVATTVLQGTLEFANERKLLAGLSGTVTALTPVGTVVGLGGKLYAVDNVPAFLLKGETPAWRGFASGMEDGVDVLQLEQNLAAMGYFDETPDTSFDWDTRYGIERWQEALGQPRTGDLRLGQVLFAKSDLLIGDHISTLGTLVGNGSELMNVSDEGKVVTADLAASDQSTVQIGSQVQISLPNGTTTSGTVTRVGEPTERETTSGTKTVIPIVVSLDDPAVAGDLRKVKVRLSFETEAREDVLFVPTTAIVANAGGGFALEVVADGNTTVVPVELGVFAAGLVEIISGDVKAGDEIVVAS